MKITWDDRARAVYVELPCKSVRKVESTFKAINTDLIYLDYNKSNELVGIEILDADEPVVENISK